MKSRVQRAQFAAALAAAVVPTAAGAQANAAVPSAPERPHCSTMRLTSAQLKAGVTSTVRCFASMDEALVAIGVAPISADVATSSVVNGLVGIHFKGFQGTGESLAIGGDNCDGGGISFANGDPWNDAIRSTEHV